MFHHFNIVSFKKGLSRIEHGIISLTGGIWKIAASPQLFGHFQSVASLGQ